MESKCGGERWRANGREGQEQLVLVVVDGKWMRVLNCGGCGDEESVQCLRWWWWCSFLVSGHGTVSRGKWICTSSPPPHPPMHTTSTTPARSSPGRGAPLLKGWAGRVNKRLKAGFLRLFTSTLCTRPPHAATCFCPLLHRQARRSGLAGAARLGDDGDDAVMGCGRGGECAVMLR